jgi:putative transposase
MLNRTLREEILDADLFALLDDVRKVARWWIQEYNEQRPHDSLGGITPAEHRQHHSESSSFNLSA